MRIYLGYLFFYLDANISDRCECANTPCPTNMT